MYLIAGILVCLLGSSRSGFLALAPNISPSTGPGFVIQLCPFRFFHFDLAKVQVDVLHQPHRDTTNTELKINPGLKMVIARRHFFPNFKFCQNIAE